MLGVRAEVGRPIGVEDDGPDAPVPVRGVKGLNRVMRVR